VAAGGKRKSGCRDRILFGAATIEKGEYLKSWIQSGIIRGLPVEIIDECLDTEVGQP
jgi:hypothetical protein